MHLTIRSDTDHNHTQYIDTNDIQECITKTIMYLISIASIKSRW